MTVRDGFLSQAALFRQRARSVRDAVLRAFGPDRRLSLAFRSFRPKVARRRFETGKVGPRDSPSPGRGRPVQLRFETDLTAEDYVSRREWRNASRPPCLKSGSGRACGMARHGTYERKTPVVMPVARFYCGGCRTTFSLLPDFAAARRPGSLQEIEDGMAVLAGSRGPWAAARQLFPERDEMSNAIRGLRRAFAAVSAFLAIVATMRPDLFRGCPSELGRCAPRWGRRSVTCTTGEAHLSDAKGVLLATDFRRQ